MDHSYPQQITTVGPLPTPMDIDDDEACSEEQLSIEEQAEMMASFVSLSSASSSSIQLFQHGRRQVSFGNVISVTPIESSSEMSQYEKDLIWFRRSELDQFKYNAKKVCRAAHKGRKVDPAIESARGMEVYFPSRQRAHGKFIYHVLQAYHVKCEKNWEYVAQLCENWSSRAKERALVTGIQDFYAAYFPHMVENTTTTTTTTNSMKKGGEQSLALHPGAASSSTTAIRTRRPSAEYIDPTPIRGA